MPTEIIPQSKKVSDALIDLMRSAKKRDEAIDRRLFEFEMMRQYGASSRTIQDVLSKFEAARVIDIDEDNIYPVMDLE